jgi:hypothetical protein
VAVDDRIASLPKAVVVSSVVIIGISWQSAVNILCWPDNHSLLLGGLVAIRRNRQCDYW